jgi:hypothetical protein
MSPPALQLEPDRVYRTQDFARWSKNPPRLAKRLVRTGQLLQLRTGLFVHARVGRFGAVPPRDEELLRRFLNGGPFVFTGPEKWNALGLGTTAMFAVPRVYNTKRTGRFTLGNRVFDLSRVAFPEQPPVEWFVVDLFEHAAEAGTSRHDLAAALVAPLRRGMFSAGRLKDMARRYGTKVTQLAVDGAVHAAA